MAYQPIEPVGLGRNVSAEMMKGGPRLQEEIKTMGPNTIKMIALQQIADQQKQKATQANLQAQTNPATVMQQVEQQVMQMGQPQQGTGLPPMRDKAQQVGGALAQKQQQQQKNMQRAAQNSQQGRPPMMAGGGLLSRPAPNIDPRYFEGGGIVAFAEGKEVRGYEPTDEEIAAERARLAQSNSYFETVPDSVIRSRLVAQYKPEINKIPVSEVDAEFERLKGPSSAMKKTRLEPYSERGYGDIDREKIRERLAEEKGGVYKKLPPTLPLGEGVRKPSEKPLEGIEALAAEMTGQLDTSKPLAPYSGPKIPQPIKQGAPKVEEVVEVVEEEVDVPDVSATGIDIPQSLKDAGQRPSTDKITQGLGALKTAGVDEEAAARTDYKKQMQLDPELKEEMNTMARRTKEREENYKPSRATTIREALAGAANRGSLGSVGAGISGAMSAREGDIQKRKDSLFKARQDSLDKLVMRSDDIAKGAVTFGADARKGFKEDARTLVDVEARMYATESADARQARQQEADIAIANAGQQFTAQVENARNTLKAQSDADLAGYRKESNVIAREGNTQRATKDRNTLINNINKGRAKTQADIAAVIAERAAALDSVEAKIPSNVDEDDPEAVAKWKKGILDAMAKTYAPMLDAYNAQLKDLGIDVPEPAAAASTDTSGFKLKGVK